MPKKIIKCTNESSNIHYLPLLLQITKLTLHAYKEKFVSHMLLHCVLDFHAIMREAEY